MNLHEYQAAAMRTAKKEEDLAGLVHASLGLASEAGEFVSEVKRMYAYGKEETEEMHGHMLEELGDALYYITLACEHLGTTLQSVARGNIDKLTKRYPHAFSNEAAEARVDKGGASHTADIPADPSAYVPTGVVPRINKGTL